MTTTYKLIFRGDIVPGYAMADVRAKLKELFRLDDALLAKLFSGRPVAIKKNLDEATANKWCELLQAAGALVESVPESGSAPPAEAAAPGQARASRTPPPSGGADVAGAAAGAEGEESGAGANYGLALSPVGADVLNPSERRDSTAVTVAVPDLGVEAVGADVLREDERTPFVRRELDLSHLEIEDISPQ